MICAELAIESAEHLRRKLGPLALQTFVHSSVGNLQSCHSQHSLDSDLAVQKGFYRRSNCSAVLSVEVSKCLFVALCDSSLLHRVSYHFCSLTSLAIAEVSLH